LRLRSATTQIPILIGQNTTVPSTSTIFIIVFKTGDIFGTFGAGGNVGKSSSNDGISISSDGKEGGGGKRPSFGKLRASLISQAAKGADGDGNSGTGTSTGTNLTSGTTTVIQTFIFEKSKLKFGNLNGGILRIGISKDSNAVKNECRS